MRSLLAPVLLSACSTPGSPFKVAILRTGGIDAEVDPLAVAEFAEEIEEMGFEVVVDAEPLPGTDLPTEARARAKAAKAANALVLELSTTQERAGVLEGTWLHAVQAEVHLVQESPETPVLSKSMEFVQEDHQAAAVERRVMDTWASALAPWATSQLHLTEPVATVVHGEVELKTAAQVSKLREDEPYVSRRTERAQEYEGYCRDQTARVEGFAQTEGLRCFGDPCGQYTLLGVDPQGRAIVQDISREPIFTIPLKGDRYWSEPPERILAVPLDDPTAEVDLIRSANLYGFGNFEPGAVVGAVETFSSEGTSAIYAFDLGDGHKHLLSLLGPREETRFSRAAPDGSGVFACLKSGSCFNDDGSGRQDLPPFRTAWWMQLDQGARIFGQLESGALALVDPADPSSPRTLRFRDNLWNYMGQQSGLVHVQTSDLDRGCSLLSIDPQTMRAVEEVPMPECLRSPRPLANGKVLATARTTKAGDVPGDFEVVLWTPGATELEVLTTGTFDEESPEITPDGDHIVFSRRLDAPPRELDVGLYRRVVCSMELP